jgi:hypothetical protein
VVWSAVPAIQWCSLRWDQICPRLVVRCLAAMERPVTVCREGMATCPLAAEATAIDARARDAGECPLAAEAGDASANEQDACPFTAETNEGGEFACPLSATAPGAATDPISTDEQAPTHHGRAYCLGDPTGGLGLRNHQPELTPPAALAPVVALAEIVTPDAPARWARPEPRARPPTRVWAILPPARAPPHQG